MQPCTEVAFSHLKQVPEVESLYSEPKTDGGIRKRSNVKSQGFESSLQFSFSFNNSVFLSEKDTADRNFALAYYMKENKCFPKGFALQECLDFYFQVGLSS